MRVLREINDGEEFISTEVGSSRHTLVVVNTDTGTADLSGWPMAALQLMFENHEEII